MTRGGDTPEKTLWKKPIDTGGSCFICEVWGKDTLVLQINREGKTPIVRDGIIVDFRVLNEQTINNLFVNPLNEKGYNIQSSGWLEKIITENKGETIPSWNKYQEL